MARRPRPQDPVTWQEWTYRAPEPDEDRMRAMRDRIALEARVRREKLERTEATDEANPDDAA
jgi:hypothetical protein